VNVPVNLFPAAHIERVPLRMLSADGTTLSRRYYSEESGKDLEDHEMIRGYEIDKDKYVTITDDELDKLSPDKSRDIDLRRFVAVRSIPPIYFERGYFLTPAGETQMAYRLLAKALEDGDRAGIGTFVMHGKEYLVAILAENGILLAQTLRYSDELRSAANVGLPEPKKPQRATVARFEKLISKHSAENLSTRELEDRQTERVLRLVRTKLSRGKDVVESHEESLEPDNVVDIMEVLKKSLAAKR
jgi:DNA end-binding protein Ku